jgi:hypothetical protein
MYASRDTVIEAAITMCTFAQRNGGGGDESSVHTAITHIDLRVGLQKRKKGTTERESTVSLRINWSAFSGRQGWRGTGTSCQEDAQHTAVTQVDLSVHLRYTVVMSGRST